MTLTEKKSDEFEYPETVYVRDIENKVFQSLVVKAISSLEGVGFIEGSMIDNLLNLGQNEGVKGIWVEQDSKHASVSVRCELNIAYGISIPEMAQKVQTTVTEELTKFTGLHVSQVHVIFKNIIPELEPLVGITNIDQIEEQAVSETVT